MDLVGKYMYKLKALFFPVAALSKTCNWMDILWYAGSDKHVLGFIFLILYTIEQLCRRVRYPIYRLGENVGLRLGGIFPA